MIDATTIKRLTDLCHKPVALGGWLGLPYNPDKGCYRFVTLLYKELGIVLHPDNQLRAFRDFIYVDKPQFCDVAVFYSKMMLKWHVGVMLDHRRMIQSDLPNGVGIIPVDVYPWPENFKGFLRHRSLCS